MPKSVRFLLPPFLVPLVPSSFFPCVPLEPFYCPDPPPPPFFLPPNRPIFFYRKRTYWGIAPPFFGAQKGKKN